MAKCKKCEKSFMTMDGFSSATCEICNNEFQLNYIPANSICEKCAKENNICEKCGESLVNSNDNIS